MYLFSDPDDPQHRYIDSWDPTLGVLSYGGYLNETFNDDDINCTIKLKPNQPHPGTPLHPEGMAFIALEWCYQDLRESGRGKNFPVH